MKHLRAIALLTILVLLLASCATPTPEVIEKVVTKEVEKVVKETVIVEKEKEVVKTVEVEVEKIITATPEPGGRMVWARAEPCEGACGNANLSAGNYVFWHAQNPAFLTICSETGAMCNLPGLAYRWEESEDHTTWTFYLREDVTWSDGTPSTADDHIFTINMVTNPDFGSHWTSKFKDVVGYQDFQDGTADGLAGLTKIDDYTFSITFADGSRREPAEWSDSYFLMPYHRMKDQTVEEWIDQKVEDRISVGPYYFTDIVYDEYYALKANPHFYLGPPHIEEWIYRAIPNWAVSIAGLKSGEIDVVDVTPLDEIPGLQEVEHLNIIPDANARGYMFWLNQNTLPKKVRQAMQKAVDRQLIIDTLWEGYGWTYPCRAQPQGVPLKGVIPDYTVHDLDAAQALLEEAIAEGYDPEYEVRLYYYYSTEFTKQIMAAVADMWTGLGLNINFQLLPTDKVVETYYEKGEYDVLYGCCADFGNREHYILLYNYYKCGLIWPDGYNAVGICNEELDAAMETINETFNRQEEIAAYQTACTVLGEEVADMPLWQSPGLWTINSRLHNTIASDGKFNEYVHTWWVEK